MIWRRLWLAVLLLICVQFSALAQEVAPGSGVTIHVVQRGETLFRIALQYGLTTDELAQLNGIADPNSIQVGQRLLVPVNGATTVDGQPVVHIVQPGETLRSIADLYGFTVEALAAMNNIADVNSIFVGQVLTIVPGEQAVPPPAAIAPPAPAAPGASLIHVVQPGETLFRIATSYGVTVNDLAQANGIADPTVIYVGQQLLIPGVEAPPLALDLPPIVSGLSLSPLVLVEGQSGRFHMTTSAATTVTALFLGRSIPASADPSTTDHVLLVGVPVFTAGGVQPVVFTLTEANGVQTTLTVNVQILAGNYGSENISLLSDRTDLLDPSLETSERSLVDSVMGTFTATRHFDGPFGLPAAATITSPFGRRRSYNGGPFDHYHSGTDFAGAPGTAIIAPAPGYVALAQPLDVRGNATIIDHGWGVFTGYWHQNEVYVRPGEFVTAGQVIGTIGATGRVTGAHLHWELWVNGTPVDPMQWVRQSFTS